MHPLIEEKREQVNDLCRRFRVKRLDVFGSAARGGFNEQSSDLDFVVEFEAGSPRGFGGVYFGLKEALEDLFDRSVDLVEARAIDNPYFRRSVEQTQVQLYAA